MSVVGSSREILNDVEETGSGPASNQETREFIDEVPIYPKVEDKRDGTDSGNASEDEEQHWEDVHNQSVSDNSFSDKKPQSILKAQPQVFVDRDALPKKKRKKKVSKKESFRNSKTVVFNFPEGMNIPERIGTEEEKRVFMVKARKTFLVLRRKLTGRKETVPWRMSVHCSPSLLQQRTKKLSKEYYLQLPQETFVRDADLSDEEDDSSNNDDGLSYRTISESSADFEIEIVTESKIEPVDDDEVFPSTSKSAKQEAVELERATLSDDEDEDLKKPSRRQEMRMIMRALHIQSQMQDQLGKEGRSKVRRRPIQRTKGRRNTMPMAGQSSKQLPTQDENDIPNEKEPKKPAKLSRKLSKDGGGRPRKISRDITGAAAAAPPSPRDSIDSLEPKQKNKLRPFKYINSRLAFKQLAQHFSGSESESGSASSSRHNSISLSEHDNISAILDGDVIRPRSVSLHLPGKVVHTRYRKVSREEASPYYKEAFQSTQSIN